jgi:hypothetical protein
MQIPTAWVSCRKCCHGEGTLMVVARIFLLNTLLIGVNILMTEDFCGKESIKNKKQWK